MPSLILYYTHCIVLNLYHTHTVPSLILYFTHCIILNLYHTHCATLYPVLYAQYHPEPLPHTLCHPLSCTTHTVSSWTFTTHAVLSLILYYTHCTILNLYHTHFAIPYHVLHTLYHPEPLLHTLCHPLSCTTHTVSSWTFTTHIVPSTLSCACSKVHCIITNKYRAPIIRNKHTLLTALTKLKTTLVRARLSSLTFAVCCYKTVFPYIMDENSPILWRGKTYTMHSVWKFTQDFFIAKLSWCMLWVKIHPRIPLKIWVNFQPQCTVSKNPTLWQLFRITSQTSLISYQHVEKIQTDKVIKFYWCS